MNAAAVQTAVQQIDGRLEPKDKRRLDYFTRQIVDMMAPTNFLATNPDALEKAVETEGQSLVDGPGKPGPRHRGATTATWW